MKYFLPSIIAILILASCSKHKDGPGVDLQTNLYTWLPFDGNIKDSVGNDNDLYVSDLGIQSIKDRTGAPNRAIAFDGKVGEIKYANIAWPGALLTVSCWVRKNNDAQQLSFITAEGFDFGMLQDLAGMSFMVRQGNQLKCPAFVNIGPEWTHLLATYNSHEIRFYVGGVLKGSFVIETNLGYIEQLFIGFSDGAHWRGSLDDFRIYGRILNEKEIEALAAP